MFEIIQITQLPFFTGEEAGSGKASEGAELSFNDFLSTLIWFIFTTAASPLLCQS